MTQFVECAQYQYHEDGDRPRSEDPVLPAASSPGAGEEITITKQGVPVARLVPVRSSKERGRKLGMFGGKIEIADDFDAPLPDEILDAFEGKEDNALKKT